MIPVEQLLKELISIPSISYDEIQIADYLCEILAKYDFCIKKIPIKNGRYSIVASVGNPKVYLQAHIDTVSPHIPYSEDETYIYGRGACDTKGCVASMLIAALQSKIDGLTNFGILFTPGEEKDFDGAQAIIESGVDLPMVIVGEPTDLKVISSHFGFLSFKIQSVGIAAHSSKPKEGRNAIVQLLYVVQKIISMKLQHGSILCLGKISGGTADNVIPSFASASFSMRIAPEDKTNYFEIISQHLIEHVTLEAPYQVKGASYKPTSELDFLPVGDRAKYFTELSFFQHGVILGPGSVNDAHKDTEKIVKSELHEAVNIYKQILKNYTK